MQFGLLVFETADAFASRHTDEHDPYTGAWRAYQQALMDAGIYVWGDPLEAPATATTVRRVDDRQRVEDGPFADTKEQLGGFFVLDVPSLAAALEWAARCPATTGGAVEVRPLATAFKQRVV